ncbi:MAG: ribonuclease P protein component [Clostridia bacterium]|nr:ribonuclease P protein component [Clostridia bacterium]
MINTISIKDSKDFQKVINKGQWFGGDYLSTYVLKNNDNLNQIGLAIGKKAGKAYKRNRIKRLIKESYTKLENSIEHGYDIVFIWKIKANYENLNYEGIYNDIKKAFKKAGILNEKGND